MVASILDDHMLIAALQKQSHNDFMKQPSQEAESHLTGQEMA
jgi:hypothetical protein